MIFPLEFEQASGLVCRLQRPASFGYDDCVLRELFEGLASTYCVLLCLTESQGATLCGFDFCDDVERIACLCEHAIHEVCEGFGAHVQHFVDAEFRNLFG